MLKRLVNWKYIYWKCMKIHIMTLRGMLHVGEVKFTPGVKFQPRVNFFWDTRTFQLGMKTENVHRGVKWIFWPFCMIFYMFSFYKNADVLISYNWQKLSDKCCYMLWAGEKENSCVYRFFISRCCKYGLLAPLQLQIALRGNWKTKGNTEIYSLLFISNLNSQSFCSRTWHLERESHFSDLLFTKCSLQ